MRRFILSAVLLAALGLAAGAAWFVLTIDKKLLDAIGDRGPVIRPDDARVKGAL